LLLITYPFLFILKHTSVYTEWKYSAFTTVKKIQGAIYNHSIQIVLLFSLLD